MVPESQDTKAHREDECVPLPIMIAACMLTAIDLNDQLALAATEIGEVRPNRKLAGELITAEFTVLQFQPEQCLGMVVILAQDSRAPGRSGFAA